MRKRIIFTERSTLPKGTREKTIAKTRNRMTAASPKKFFAMKIATIKAIIRTIFARASMLCTKDFAG